MLANNWKFLLKRRGRKAVLRINKPGYYDPNQASLSNLDDEYEVKAYFSASNLMEGLSTTSGTRLVAMSSEDTDKRVTPQPKTSDKLVVDGKELAIKEIQTIFNGETPVVYLCMVAE